MSKRIDPKQTLFEKHGRYGSCISTTFETNEILIALQKLLKLKSRSAVIRFLVDKFVSELNQKDKQKEMEDLVKEKYNSWINPREEFMTSLKAVKDSVFASDEEFLKAHTNLKAVMSKVKEVSDE